MQLCIALSLLVAIANAVDDFHYPAEEPAEWAATVIPTVVSVQGKNATLELQGQRATVQAGSTVFPAEWHVLSVLSATGAVALELNFARWALIVIAKMNTAPIQLRKSVGDLSKIQQPYFNFTHTDPAYFTNIGNSLRDLVVDVAAAQAPHGEPDYPSVAGGLAPQRDIVEISNANDVVKFVVTYNGRIKCATTGITELINQTAPMPNEQVVVFDPATVLEYWPEQFENSKTGLVGGHLRIANVGAFSTSVQKGYDLVAFSPIYHPSLAFTQQVARKDMPCHYSGPIHNSYLANCPQAGCKPFQSLTEAEGACNSMFDCGGITLHAGFYETRQSNAVLPSPYNETAWLLQNAGDCHALPRLPYINYEPGVYVRIREQDGTNYSGIHQYMYVNNKSRTPVTDTEFYTQLVDYVAVNNVTFSTAMLVQLPANDRRQVDMAYSGILSSINNFVGHQPNYGDGATYWSVDREDNGSLPLNILSVGDALLDWNMCNVALPNIGFYFDNYVFADGTIRYYTWGTGQLDSIADTGRLIELYLKAVSYCGDSAWSQQYLPTAVSFGNYLLRLWQAAQHSAPDPGCKGLLLGAPEHDWAEITNLRFYNNNVWTLRGLERLGGYLADIRFNATFSQQLLNAGQTLRSDLATSLAICVVRNQSGAAIFLPPYASVNATPYHNMTESREASYANFRFYSETLLADVLPREVENVFLHFHNDMGGRVGGASRFEGWLDDMPTAGWGYGALTNNRTQDYLALLYGSPGFHPILNLCFYAFTNYLFLEQRSCGDLSESWLQWLGEGWYRYFLHWPNPNEAALKTKGAERDYQASRYYANENDISFCIVSQILLARLTRWQLVFDDNYRQAAPIIWLARAAPRRWFDYTVADVAFSVKDAPTSIGLVSFEVRISKTGLATFLVSSPCAEPTPWRVRFAGGLTAKNPTCTGCELQAVDPTSGVVAVMTTTVGSFAVEAQLATI